MPPDRPTICYRISCLRLAVFWRDRWAIALLKAIWVVVFKGRARWKGPPSGESCPGVVRWPWRCNMKGWKTIAVAVLSFAIYTLAWPGLVELVDPQLIAQIAAVLMLVMRFLTATPIGKAR